MHSSYSSPASAVANRNTVTDWWNFLESTAHIITLSPFCAAIATVAHFTASTYRGPKTECVRNSFASVLQRSWNLRLLMLSLFASQNSGKTHQIQQPCLFPARNSVNANVASHATIGQKFSVHVSSSNRFSPQEPVIASGVRASFGPHFAPSTAFRPH